MNVCVSSRWSLILLLALLSRLPLVGQVAVPLSAAPAQAFPTDSGILTLFPHPDTTRFLISGQANIVFQSHGPMHSPYEGLNSFLSRGEYKTSLIGTLFLGYQPRRE